MNIGTVIRKYRKEKQLTQEEVAGYLGVTAPAVNKWENGNSLPDISLLAPIARLLGISTDMLLSFREELTEEEMNEIIRTVSNRIKSGEDYGTVFSWAEKRCRSIQIVTVWRFRLHRCWTDTAIYTGTRKQKNTGEKSMACMSAPFRAPTVTSPSQRL